MSVQPPISTIPCKILYLLANPVLPFLMFSSPTASPTNPSLRPRPSHSNRCHPERSEGSAFLFSPIRALSVSAFSSPDVSSFNFRLSTACPEHSRRVNSLFNSCPFNFEVSTVNCLPVSPFPATLAANSHLTENSATLSPVPATLTRRVNPNPFVCHSYRKPGVGHIFQAKIFSFGNLTTNYSPLSTISFTFRTYEKRARNSRRIRTSKTQHLKPFRMNTYKKTGGGPLPGTLFSLPHYIASSQTPKEAPPLQFANNAKLSLGGDTVSTEAVAARRHAGTHLPVTWWKLEMPTTTWHLLLN